MISCRRLPQPIAVDLAQQLRLPSSRHRCQDLHPTNLEVVVVTFVGSSVKIFFNRAFSLKVYRISICFVTLFVHSDTIIVSFFRRQHSLLVSRWVCRLPLTIQELLGLQQLQAE